MGEAALGRLITVTLLIISLITLFGTCMAEELELPFGSMPPFFHEFVIVVPESSFRLCCHLSRISFPFL